MIKADFEIVINDERRKRAREVLEEIYDDDMGGWAKLPSRINREEISKIKEVAKKINEDSEYLVCIGIGGSYLGHRAIIEALGEKSRTKILYAGNSLSERELKRVVDMVSGADFSVNVISKSGTTLEPSVAFQVFKEKLTQKYGKEEATRRIYATTDARKGELHDESEKEGYTSFIIPDNVGGRYSVFTAVGLLPLAVAGIDIDKLLEGALEEEQEVEQKKEESSAVRYAILRNALLEDGYDVEVFATAEPSTAYVNEWLKQLFGESEGKNKQGIFPASVVYSTDLHSMGQYLQDGRRNIFETIIDYPTDKRNAKIVPAVTKAHRDGGIPVLNIIVPSFDEKGLGALLYFFEMVCAVSGKLSGVNPFDQPGVEAYKKELKKLLTEAV
ncbi:glucose-6-phosphate isomerase [Candidatus Saccharibacteria bacterium]|nr:glucose-6-phosphate isomerase [Candidatus Saccharibacteria bacterium]